MSLWQRSKSELIRVLRLDLHSYWEVFYLDAIVVFFGFLLSFPICWLLNWLSIAVTVYQFYDDNIKQPVKINFVARVVPRHLTEWVTYVLIKFIEIAFVHLINCDLYRRHKKGYKCEVSFWQQTKSELKRLIRLDLHSYWEVFYLDAIVVFLSFSLSFIITGVMMLFSIPDTFSPLVYEYVVKPVETNVVRHIAPSGLCEATYKLIAIYLTYFIVLALIHLLLCALYREMKLARQFEANIQTCRSCSYGTRFVLRQGKGRKHKASLCQRIYFMCKELVVCVVIGVLFCVLLIWLGLFDDYTRLLHNYITLPLENNVVKLFTPSDLDKSTVRIITYGLTISIGMLILCAMIQFTYYMSQEKQQISQHKKASPSDVELGCLSRVGRKVEEKRELLKSHPSSLEKSSFP